MKRHSSQMGHILSSLCGILICLILLTSCRGTNAKKEIFSYQNISFTAELRGELSGAPFEGTLIHAAAGDNSAGLYSFSFRSPEALAGITVSTQAQNTTVSLDGICIKDDRWRTLAWTEIARLFSLEGEPLSITTDRERGEMTVVFQTAEGAAYTVTLDSNTERPKWIEGDGIRVEILSFT